MYYFIGVSEHYPNYAWVTYTKNSNLELYNFLCNEVISEPIIYPVFETGKRINIERFVKYDLVMSDLVPLFSARFKDLISEKAPGDVQFIKSFIYHKSELIGTYFIPVFLKVIDCINWKESIYDEQIGEFKKIMIADNALGDNKIVKAKDFQFGLPIIQEGIYRECKKMNIQGCEFYPNPYINPLFN